MKVPALTASVVERFHNSYTTVPEAGCWIWILARRITGYGVFHARDLEGVRRNWGAHRISYQVANGPIPPGMCICHKCDTPACVNPDHLFVGTQAENIADMRAKGRGHWGQGVRRASGRRRPAHHSRRLSVEQVLEIRQSSEHREVLATRYGVSEKTIRNVIARTYYSEIGDCA